MVLVGIIISYLLGSIPTAYLYGRALKGIDIRKFGSGNVGATNAFRVLGPLSGVIVLILDVLKGIISVTVVANYFPSYSGISLEVVRIIYGITCVCGHNWTLFLRFRGGKGVATTLGVLAGLAIAVVELRLILFLVILVWFLTFLSFRFVSLASVLSAISLPIFVFIFHPLKELLILSLVLAIFIVIRHKKNLLGLLSGKEHSLYFKSR